MEDNVQQQTEKPFNPNRAQRRAGMKAYVKAEEKARRALAANHPQQVVDRRKVRQTP